TVLARVGVPTALGGPRGGQCAFQVAEHDLGRIEVPPDRIQIPAGIGRQVRHVPEHRVADRGNAHRGGGPGPARAAASVSIAAVGDTMLGNMPDLPADPGRYLDPVRRDLDSAQIVFGNLEGTLTTAGTTKCGRHTHPGKDCFAFRVPPGYARYLKAAGFTILNDANNHSFDFGPAGQAQTVRAIHS